MTDGLSVRKPGFRIGASFRLALSLDGQRLATVGKRVTVWNVGSRQRVASAHPFSHESSVDISPTGPRLAVKNTLGDVAILQLDSMDVTLRLPGAPYGEGTRLRFSPCGELIVDASWRGDFLVRHARSGDILLHEPGPPIYELSCTPDRRHWLYVRAGVGAFLRSWPFTDHEAVPLTGDALDGGPLAAALSTEATQLAVARWQEVATFQLDGRNLIPIATYPVPTSGTGQALAWHPSGHSLAYAGAGQALVLTPELQPLWQAEFHYPSDTAYSATGDLLAIGDWSRGMVLRTPA